MELNNFKILVFSGEASIYHILNFLQSHDKLGGIAFDKGDTPAIQQLQQSLVSSGIAMLNYLPSHMDEVKGKIAEFSCDVALIFGFGHILPKEIIDLFPRGVYNIHPSPLPYYKGAQPIFWQLRNNEQKTALTLHQVTEHVDSGPIVKTLPIEISPFDIYGSLAGEIMQKSMILVEMFLNMLFESKNKILEGTPQKKLKVDSHYPRPKIEDVRIDWHSMGADEISALSRAAQAAFQGAHTTFSGAPICIVQASKSSFPTYNAPPGTIISVDEHDGLIVALNDGAICIDIVAVADGIFTGAIFAIRYKIEAGMRLG